MAGDAAAACTELLVGLDEDTLEYVVGCVTEDGEVLPKEELSEFLAPLLVDAEICEDDAAAEALAVRLWARLKGEDEGGVAGAEGDAGPKLLTNTEPDPEATL
jgi:hypothetical protein